MSRIGKQPIKVPAGVTVKLNGTVLEVKGAKGTLTRETFGRISLAHENDEINVKVPNEESNECKKYWGLYRTLLSNMVVGVSKGFERSLEVIGTGYRASLSGKNLNLTVGFSHPVSLEPPQGVAFDVDKAGKIIVTGADNEMVGQMAAKIRAIRPAEPYQGKGIRYNGEVIATKVGKSTSKK